MKIVVYDLDDTLYDTSLIKNRELIRYDPKLNELLTLNHPSYIYSNATQAHVLDIMERKSFFGLIKKIYARRKDDIFMKPNITGFRSVEEDILYSENISLFDPYEIYFFDDLIENLKTAKSLGWKTIHINKNTTKTDYRGKGWIDYKYSDIKESLKDLREKKIL